jgi:GNAT superfamily N-acetyltransferase
VKPASPGGLTIRPARAEDAGILAALVRELNAHQGDPTDRFDAAAARRDGFGDPRRFETLLAETDGQPVGYALFVPAYESAYALAGLYVADLYVVPSHRRRGVGRALLAALATEARTRGLGFLWWVSRAWNTDAHAFFRRVAAVEDPVLAFATFGEPLERLAAEDEARRRRAAE